MGQLFERQMSYLVTVDANVIVLWKLAGSNARKMHLLEVESHPAALTPLKYRGAASLVMLHWPPFPGAEDRKRLILKYVSFWISVRIMVAANTPLQCL